MKFEYEITTHPSGDFRRLAYFCSDRGECDLNPLENEEFKALSGLLNEKGAEGWELIQMHFGQQGVVGFWKRMVSQS